MSQTGECVSDKGAIELSHSLTKKHLCCAGTKKNLDYHEFFKGKRRAGFKKPGVINERRETHKQLQTFLCL